MTLEQFVKDNYQKKNPQFKDWETPPDFFKKLDDEFRFTVDVAANHHNALLRHYCTPAGMFNRIGDFSEYKMVSELDGLTHSWLGERVFCNPPYDKTISNWVDKAFQFEANVAVLLLPPNFDTKWGQRIWQRYQDSLAAFDGMVEIRLPPGRLQFFRNGKPGDAPRAGNLIAIFRR